MVKTAATAVRTGGGKSSKGVALSGGWSSGSGSSKRSTIGGNKPMSRPIPQWQKTISSFLTGKASVSSSAKIKSEPQASDTESDEEPEVPKWQKPISMFLTNKNMENVLPAAKRPLKKAGEGSKEPNKKQQSKEIMEDNDEVTFVDEEKNKRLSAICSSTLNISFKDLEELENA